MTADKIIDRWSRRRVWRWVANLLIIGGVLLLAYPAGTWGYTWYEQRHLRAQLERDNPQLVAAEAALGAQDMVQVMPAVGGTTGSIPAGTGAGQTAAGQGGAAQVSPGEAARLAQLAAFKAAADAFDASIGSRSEIGTKSGQPLGRILIPSIGVNKVIVEGTGDGDLRTGPGHWPETPFPGQGGNFVISGHRTTYGAPFLKLNKVKVGDEIDVILPYAVARYVVTRTLIVGPKDVESVAQLGKEQISLAACHPIYSASHRIVVQGDLVALKLIVQ